MRDLEFGDEFERLTPKLHRLFWRSIRTFRGDPEVEVVDDLLKETAKEALHNSRLPQYVDYTYERLIFEKAYNVMHKYCHPPQKNIRVLSLEEAEDQVSAQDPYYDLITRKWLERVYTKVKPETWIICYLTYAGYRPEEIAVHLGITVPELKLRLSRVKKDLTGKK